MDGFGELFGANMPTNPNFSSFMDKNNPNQDFFLNPNNNQNLAVDSNLLYNFPSINSASQQGLNPSSSDPSAMYQQNRNAGPQGNVPNQNFYEDFMKNSKPSDFLNYNQLAMYDKNLMNPSMLADNMGLMGIYIFSHIS